MSAHGTLPPTRGFSLLEVVFALGLLSVVLLGVTAMNSGALQTNAHWRQRARAAQAAYTVRQALETVRFRKLNATDQAYFLYGKGGAGTSTYPLGWWKSGSTDGTAFQMPNCDSLAMSTQTVTGTGAPGGVTAVPATYANPYSATVDGVSGCICVEFPVQGLQPPRGRLYPGRVVFYLSEKGQPAGIPTAAFPFSPTPGLGYLDCDGCGLAQTSATTDLRTGYVGSTHPYYLIPVRISVDWKVGTSAQAAESYYATYFLLSYRGYD